MSCRVIVSINYEKRCIGETVKRREKRNVHIFLRFTGSPFHFPLRSAVNLSSAVLRLCSSKVLSFSVSIQHFVRIYRPNDSTTPWLNDILFTLHKPVHAGFLNILAFFPTRFCSQKRLPLLKSRDAPKIPTVHSRYHAKF